MFHQYFVGKMFTCNFFCEFLKGEVVNNDIAEALDHDPEKMYQSFSSDDWFAQMIPPEVVEENTVDGEFLMDVHTLFITEIRNNHNNKHTPDELKKYKKYLFKFFRDLEEQINNECDNIDAYLADNGFDFDSIPKYDRRGNKPEDLGVNHMLCKLKIDLQSTWQRSMSRVRKEFDDENESSNTNPNNTNKLNWNGNANQLYSVLKQLKEKDLLPYTYDQITTFVRQNFVGFDQTNQETTRRELARNKNLPKNKRVNLDLDESE